MIMNTDLSFTRRTFLAGISMAALGLFGRQITCADPTPSATVTVNLPHGVLRGATAEGVNSFVGIPFAQPPIDSLRFKPSLPISPWSGILDATKEAHSAWQSLDDPQTQSEDCLYLNIWAPQGSGPFPVFVWFHGGGYTNGGAGDPGKRTAFTSDGIIVVSVAYRLGIFGFLDYSQLLGTDYAGTANNALTDAINALEWIQQNISAFGGDPNRVTIGGESAGAKLVDTLLGIPSAQPLFQQVISESGGAERIYAERFNALDVADSFAQQCRNVTGESSVDLLALSPQTLIKSQNRLVETWPHHFPLRPEIDGKLIPQLPVRTIADGSSKGKRLLIGTNKDESALFFAPNETRDISNSDLGNLALAAFTPVLDQYAAIYPEMNAVQRKIRALTAEEYWIPSIRTADAHVQGGGKVWMYRLDFTESTGALAGYAYHSLDVGMVWGDPHRKPGNAALEADLGEQIHAAWAAFIHGEAPIAPGLPEWPEYESRSRSTILLDVTSSVEQSPHERELRLWDHVL